jgi:hypothetical protein
MKHTSSTVGMGSTTTDDLPVGKHVHSPCTLCTLGDEPGCEACRAVEPEGEAKQTVLYRIVHVPTGRLYVGVHGIEGDAFEDDGYMGGGPAIRAAVKEDRAAFRKEILAVCPTEHAALELERALVGPEQVASDRYFNQCLGGGGGIGLSEESREKHRAARRAWWKNATQEQRDHNLGGWRKARGYWASLTFKEQVDEWTRRKQLGHRRKQEVSL